MAANPLTGHILVTELKNARISEFTAWGAFIKAWGFGVKTGAAKLEVCTAESGCQGGIKGAAAGQLQGPTGIAIDSSGNVYVYDAENLRVVKYDEDGNFLLAFGGNVNEDTGGEICTAASGDECGAGTAGAGPGFFSNDNLSDFIDVSASGTVYVGDKGRIQEFNADGTFKDEITFSGDLTGVSPFGLAVDPVSGDVYVSTDVGGDPIYRISPTGELVDEVEATIQVNSESKTFPRSAAGISVDSEGNLYAVDHKPSLGFSGPFEVLKFSPSGECLICGQKLAQPDDGSAFGKSLMGLATSDACGVPSDNLYVTVFNGSAPPRAYLQSYGPAPQDVETCPPPKVAPDITDQFATDVGVEDAEVMAKINPHFWIDTTYYVQYGPQQCLDSGWTTDCTTEPAPPGALLTDSVLGGSVTTAPVALKDLERGTTYHYRFIAQSSGGGPVTGQSSTFRTFPETLSSPPCPNDDLRSGLAALLPDCRAYEMVSPVDKDGGDITTQKSIRAYAAELALSSFDGDTATYSSSTSFADSVSSPYTSQYLAKRDPEAGWQTHAISPPRDELFSPAGKAEKFELDVQFKRFSPDLSQAWLMQEADPPLDACGLENYINWYRRDNLTDGYEAITTNKPASLGTLEYFSEVQGASADGRRTIFRANDKLLDLDGGLEAANISGYQIYEHIAGPDCGETRLVSVLPGGTANTTESSVGMTEASQEATWIEARENLVQGAVSDDASVIYWTAAGEGPGKIYVRVNGSKTREVSAGAARFWQGSADGAFAYYTEGENLFRYSLAGKSKTEIATQVVGLVGASEGGTRAYFVSKAAIGGEGTAGQPNLYFFDGGTTMFIATISAKDVDENFRRKPVTPIPVSRTSSLSEDGRFLAFTSDADLTGTDNSDASSELPDTEAYFYEADSDELRCLSCSFTGARPSGRVEPATIGNERRGYASRIPIWKNQFHAPRVISADGSTVFFESLERLVPRDTNGVQDVYMWNRAADEAACEAIGAELFNPTAGGCISLISSGTGTGDAEFVDSTPDASNVFFKTPVSLVPQDPSRIDLYDARVDGGFPPPPGPSQCPTAADCPVPPPMPQGPTPNSEVGGPGNPEFRACEKLEAKAAKLHARAARQRAKAARASGFKAKQLKKQARKQAKQARRLSAKAKSCNAKLVGG